MKNKFNKALPICMAFLPMSINSAYAEEEKQETASIYCTGISDGSNDDGKANRFQWLKDSNGRTETVRGTWVYQSIPGNYGFQWSWAFHVEPEVFDRVNRICTEKYGDLAAAQPSKSKLSTRWYRLMTTDRVYYKFSSRYYKVDYKDRGQGYRLFWQTFYQIEDSPFQWISNPSAYW
jgi:hypothetical protein